MEPVSPEAFAALVRDLDRAALAAFVADLWAARGFETRVESDAVVRATDGDGERRTTLLIHASGGLLERPPAPPDNVDVDAVIAADPDADATLAADRDADLLGPTDLREMALYGIDREDCRHLFETHFDRSHRRRTPPPDAGESAPCSRVVPIALAAVLVLGTVVAAVVPGAFDPSRGDAAVPSTGGGAVEGGAAPSPTADDDAGPPDADRGYPPGVTADGVANASALGRAHADAVAGDSYHLTIVREEYDGEYVGGIRERVTVAAPTQYVGVTDRVGSIRGTPYLVRKSDRYADGRNLYVRRDDAKRRYETHELAAGTPGPVAQHGARAIARTLATWRSNVTAVPASKVAAGDRNATRPARFRVTGWGAPHSYEGVLNYSVSALVDSRGIVSVLRAEYEVPVWGVTVVITLRYDRFGEARVHPPTWYERSPDRESANATPRNQSAVTGSP